MSSSPQTGFLDSLVSAVRENPLAAALVGGGAFWLLVGNDRLKYAANSVTPLFDSGEPATTGLRRTAAPPTVPEMDQEASRVGESLRHATGTAFDAVSGTADKIKGGVEDGVAYAREKIGNLGNPLPGKRALTNAQSSLTDLLERQPLVIAAIGVTIGAAFAGAFPASDLENEWMGELSDGARADLSRRAGSVSQSLGKASDTIKAELSDTGAEALDRLRQTGMEAVDAARSKLKSANEI